MGITGLTMPTKQRARRVPTSRPVTGLSVGISRRGIGATPSVAGAPELVSEPAVEQPVDSAVGGDSAVEDMVDSTVAPHDSLPLRSSFGQLGIRWGVRFGVWLGGRVGDVGRRVLFGRLEHDGPGNPNDPA